MATHFKRKAPTLARVGYFAIPAAMLLLGGAHAATAQDLIADAIPMAVREGAGLIEAPPVVGITGRALPKPKYRILLGPNYVATARASVYGAAIGFASDSALCSWPFQLFASTKRLDVGPTLQTSLGAEVKLTPFPNQKLAQFLTKAGYQRTLDVSKRQEYLLAAEREIIPGQNPLALGASIAYVVIDPDLGPRTDGSKLASGLTWTLYTATRLKADYVLKTGIATEDDFSFSLQQPFPRLPYSPVLIVVGAKHRVIAVSVVTTLYTRQ